MINSAPTLFGFEFDMSTPYFFLNVHQLHRQTDMLMDLKIPEVNTIDVPATFGILNEALPNVLRSKCFNEENLSFKEEVKRTEIGHLFEHILLEYLCEQKMSFGRKSAVFRGVTNWNWIEEKRGTFHISVSCGKKEARIFWEALEKATRLLISILNTKYNFAPLNSVQLLPLLSSSTQSLSTRTFQ